MSYIHILETFSDAQSKHLAAAYLEKYWLTEEECQNQWLPVKDKIYRREAKYLPDLMFREGFQLSAMIGGIVLTEDIFQALHCCIMEAGDNWILMIENEHNQPLVGASGGGLTIHPLLRFKFPATITWEELQSGGGMSEELFETSYKEYFIFGDSAKWGMYVACEYWHRSFNPEGIPLDILGYKPELAKILKREFIKLQTNKELILRVLPPSYKEIM